VLRQRHAAITRAHDAAVFGIIVSKKIGQERMDMARGLKALAEKHDRRASIFIMDLVSPEFLEGYRVDAWVNTACPRIAIEDVLQYKQPMLTPQEFEIVLGEREWSDYVFDEIRA
jgi:2-(3-amino-3-carboxypropyl)histidine synthase